MEEQREESEFVGDSIEEEEEAGKGLGLSSKTETLDDGEDTNNTVQVSDSDVEDGNKDNLVSDVKADEDVALTVTDPEIDGDAEVKMNGETVAKSQVKSGGEGETVISGGNEVTANDNASCEVEDSGDAEQNVHTEKSQQSSVDAEMVPVTEKKADQEKKSTKNLEETVGSETKDAEQVNPGTVLEASSAAEVNGEENITNEEEKGEAMEIDYAAEELVEDDVKVGEALDNPVAEADVNNSNVVSEMEIDEQKDNADKATETIVASDLANPNSPPEDAAPGNIQDLKTDTRNISLKEDKKATGMAEEAATVAIENGSTEAPVASGAQSPVAATECSKEASDANLGSEGSKDHACLDTKTADQQDAVIEEEDIITHESQSIDPNQKEDTGMEEDPSNSDFADDEAGSDVKTNGVKRKADVLSEDSPGEGTKTVSLAKVSFAERPSFKIGACIARAASQMTGSSLVLKGSNCDDETLSVESFVSQLHSAATDPDKENVVSEIAAGFFLDFRNSSALQQGPPEKVGKKRGRPSNSDVAGTEAFEFEEMGDTYWTDRVIHNGGEEQTPPTEKGNYQVVPVELKPAQVQRTRRPYKRRQTQIHIPLSVSDKPANFDENAPAELVMKFSEADTIPPEKSLSKMFRHFGPIRESQTEVDKENNRVVKAVEEVLTTIQSDEVLGLLTETVQSDEGREDDRVKKVKTFSIPLALPWLWFGSAVELIGTVLGYSLASPAMYHRTENLKPFYLDQFAVKQARYRSIYLKTLISVGVDVLLKSVLALQLIFLREMGDEDIGLIS
ncbi:PREDICTED: DNA ligase 1-like [Camelina sativa]|uniref:DNA ligase 1-like n=1 Tax=Camelina sativa TaxID=90675 RepID=A0ABM0X5Y0_CAMSA|nr:PREDICTED: DNA ligase 1-like [Camelina sativa]